VGIFINKLDAIAYTSGDKGDILLIYEINQSKNGYITVGRADGIATPKQYKIYNDRNGLYFKFKGVKYYTDEFIGF